MEGGNGGEVLPRGPQFLRNRERRRPRPLLAADLFAFLAADLFALLAADLFALLAADLFAFGSALLAALSVALLVAVFPAPLKAILHLLDGILLEDRPVVIEIQGRLIPVFFIQDLKGFPEGRFLNHTRDRSERRGMFEEIQPLRCHTIQLRRALGKLGQFHKRKPEIPEDMGVGLHIVEIMRGDWGGDWWY